MSRVSAGTVTLVFTDIEGSTQLLHTLGGQYATLLADHHRMLGEAFREHDGTEQGTAGDGLYFTFLSARSAVLGAIAAQRALGRHAWPDGTDVRVRMGIHTGEPAQAATGYVGIDVHRAARIGSAGHGGQILVSQTTRDLVATDLSPEITFIDLGEHHLKDLPEPERLYQVATSGLDPHFPALRTDQGRLGNLPRQLTTFVGRERETAEGLALLEAAPLVTLTGPGGVGKTRLALRIAGEVSPPFEDGAWLVELGSVVEGAFVALTVAATLGVVEQPGRSALASVVDHLRGRRLLLILDNCEHLLAACAELAHGVLLACSSVRILATSQEALGVDGEALLPIPSLALPADGRLAQPEQLLQFEAVRLFVERAQAASPTFRLTSANAASVTQVCRRLDGIPLALELAAARLRALSVEQIAARLDDRFRLLTGGSRVAVPRHQTLRATMDWSYELLSPDEQALLRRLSVFAGGFGLEAAEAVGSGGPVDAIDVLDLLARLVDRSLVQAESDAAETRYRLSEIVREYVFEQLQGSGEATETRQRQRDWYLAFVEHAVPELQHGPAAGPWLDRLDVELENLRTALEWSEAQPGEQEAGLRLAAGLWRFCEIRGHIQEGRRWLERMLAATKDKPTALRANALTGAGILASMEGDHQAAFAFHEESLDLHRRLGNATAISYAINNLANAALQRGDLERALELYEQSTVIARQLDDRRGLPFALMNQADVLGRLGDETAAQARFDESMAIFRALGDRWGEAYALDSFGLVASRRGDAEAAHALHLEAAAISGEIGDERGVARALTNLADLARQTGDLPRARGLYRDSLTVRRGLRDMPGTASAMEKLAGAVMADDAAAAARLVGAAEALRETIRARVPLAMRGENERLVGELEARLGAEVFAAERSSGRELGPDGVLATLPP